MQTVLPKDLWTWLHWLNVASVTLVLVATVTSCVIIPYEPSADIAYASEEPPLAEDMIITAGPRKLLLEVSDAIQQANPDIDVVDSLYFRDRAFPDGDWRVARVMDASNCKLIAHASGVDYLVLVAPVQVREDGIDGPFVVWIGFYGIGTTDSEAKLSATVIDLRRGQVLLRVESTAQGKGGALGWFYGVFVVPETLSGAIEGLGQEVAKSIAREGDSKKIKLAVLALEEFKAPGIDPQVWLEKGSNQEEPLAEAYYRYLREPQVLGLNSTQWLERAESGDSEAQLQIYWNTVSKERQSAHRWLCRSAENGNPDARYRIGALYQHGAEGVSKDNAHAFLWYELARLAGSSQAALILDVFVPTMTSGEKKKGKLLLVDWTFGLCKEAFEKVTPP